MKNGLHGLHLFQGYGIELEYMIVDNKTLSVLPVADRLIEAAAGSKCSSVRMGDQMWSNELTLHIIEIKTESPAAQLSDLPEKFNKSIFQINMLLAPWGGRLMPTAMHPWMDPVREMKLWPYQLNEIYAAYHRIFDCRGHGWSNIQSVHINLPFKGDDEFSKLHAAIRLVLPIIPAIAASSPIIERKLTGFMDTRLEFYRHNQIRVPSIAGSIIPEPVFTQKEYETTINQKIYADIAPYDTDNILREEWLNSRGAIARFDRETIEIRLLDIQESPIADMAVCAAIITLIRSLVEEKWCDLETMKSWETPPLADMLLRCIQHADYSVIDDAKYLKLFRLKKDKCSAIELWRHIISSLAGEYEELNLWKDQLSIIINRGTLARRIVSTMDDKQSKERTFEIYKKLCDCLNDGTLFTGL